MALKFESTKWLSSWLDNAFASFCYAFKNSSRSFILTAQFGWLRIDQLKRFSTISTAFVSINNESKNKATRKSQQQRISLRRNLTKLSGSVKRESNVCQNTIFVVLIWLWNIYFEMSSWAAIVEHLRASQDIFPHPWLYFSTQKSRFSICIKCLRR